MDMVHQKRRHYLYTTCDRCNEPATSLTMSWFNTEMICEACDIKEHNHPDFERARKVEFDAVQVGDYYFPGVGKPVDL